MERGDLPNSSQQLSKLLPDVVALLCDQFSCYLPFDLPSIEAETSALVKTQFLPMLQSPEILVQMCRDSCRLAVRVQIGAPEMRCVLAGITQALHRMVAPTIDRLPRPSGVAPSVAATPECGGAQMGSEPNTRINTYLYGEMMSFRSTMDVDDVVAYLNRVEDILIPIRRDNNSRLRRLRMIRKSPIAGYDLTLLLTSSDLLGVDPSEIPDDVTAVLDCFETHVEALTRASARRCDALGELYAKGLCQPGG